MTLGHSFLSAAVSTPAAALTDEAQVPAYVLPSVLQTPKSPGRQATTVHEWEAHVRPALLEAFATHIYGHTPRVDVTTHTSDDSTHEILGGKALLRQTRLHFHHADRDASIDVVLVLPANASPSRPAPALIGLNFWGNHTLSLDPAFRASAPAPGMESKERGSFARRWPLETLIDQGYAVVTAFRGEITPDNPQHHQSGVLSLFPENTGESRMGAVGAWSWTLSRLADHALTFPDIDATRLTVVGHSRLGKAALWAAAQDTRFSRVFANNSGCMGGALSRREFGETVALITRGFPYWFTPLLATYGDRVNELPVDQHQLIALIAPRPVHIGTAQQDLWADPRGELLALRAAAPAYALYGIHTELPDQLPPADAKPIGTALRFHQREGSHDILPSDWQAYLGHPDPR
jgi:hypothetical protein